MKTAHIMAVAELIAESSLAVREAQSQQPGDTRTDVQRQRGGTRHV